MAPKGVTVGSHVLQYDVLGIIRKSHRSLDNYPHNAPSQVDIVCLIDSSSSGPNRTLMLFCVRLKVESSM